MAPRCTAKWNSWINPSEIPPTTDPTDGQIVIGNVTGGNFVGSHIVNGMTHTKLKGKCKDNPRHHIKFDSEENGVIFTYEGVIVDIPEKTALGKRSRRNAVDRKEEMAQGDEVWVGVKTT